MQTESLPKEGQSFVSPVSPEETFFLSATRVSAKTFLNGSSECGHEKVHDAEDDEGMDTEMVSADAGKDRPDSESPISTDGECPHRFPLLLTTDAVHHESGFRMEECTSHAAEDGAGKDGVVVREKSHCCHGKSAEDGPSGTNQGREILSE